jgi:hypothetical protein
VNARVVAALAPSIVGALLGTLAGEHVASAAGPVMAQAASGPRILHGPGGKQLVEVPMPQGFRPIRLVGLNGVPVAGHPVTETTGALNPRNWEGRDANLSDVDVGFERLLEALLVGAQPKLLQGITFAEAFALRHLDAPSLKTFFPALTVKPGPFMTSTFGRNEFERKQLFERFLKQYEAPLSQSGPRTPFEFTYVELVLLGAYDQAGAAFPLSNRQGERGPMTLHALSAGGRKEITVKVPSSLPIEPSRAQELLGRVPNQQRSPSLPPIRHVYLGLRLAVTGFATGQNRQQEVHVEPRAAGLYEDPLLTRLIHEYPAPEKGAPPPATASIPATPLLPHLVSLFALRDVEGFLDDKGLLHATTFLIKDEQNRRGQVKTFGGCREKNTAFEWAAANSDLANGPLLSVLMQPAADWSFLDRETRFGMVADHCVEVYVFPGQRIEGRPADFAAKDMAPVYRKTVEAAIGQLPKTVFIASRLPAAQYDHGRKVLVFKARGGEERPDGTLRKDRPAQLLPVPRSVEYLTPGQASKSSSGLTTRAPKSAASLAIYGLAVHDNKSPALPPPQPRSMSNAPPGEGWRRSVEFFRGDRRDQPRAIAIDRLLAFPEVGLDPATAEQLIKGEGRPGDQTMRALIVLEMQKTQSVGSGSPPLLFARLERVLITTQDGREVARLDAASFPDAATSQSPAKAGAEDEKERDARARAEQKAGQQARRDEARDATGAELAQCDAANAGVRDRRQCYRTVCGRPGTDRAMCRAKHLELNSGKSAPSSR